MGKVKFAMQTRTIKVMHPYFKDVVLFEAKVKIVNMNTSLVEKIEGVNINYKLREKN